MKFIDEFRARDLIKILTDRIMGSASGTYSFMEVCGGHTNAIRRFGIHSILPENIKLISGPGCPVCVTGQEYIDKLIACSKNRNNVIATFGDLIRVPGSESSLEKEKGKGSDIRIVISPLEALEIAKANPSKTVIFAGIGFEATAPGSAVTLKMAQRENIENFHILSAHKIMPPAMEAIIHEGVKINGFICPGHVSATAGSKIFNFIPEKYSLGCVISGFEPVDILQSILLLMIQVNVNTPGVEIQYSRAVSEEGNLIAQKHMTDVFELCDINWRGLGIIPLSGLKIKDEFKKFDAVKFISEEFRPYPTDSSCICGEILRGLKTPHDCSLFRIVCDPENPVGACMVSNEGACNAWYKYGSNG